MCKLISTLPEKNAQMENGQTFSPNPCEEKATTTIFKANDARISCSGKKLNAGIFHVLFKSCVFDIQLMIIFFEALHTSFGDFTHFKVTGEGEEEGEQ